MPKMQALHWPQSAIELARGAAFWGNFFFSWACWGICMS